ncbi:MAG: hypothetical protein HYT07_01715 [Candidatus Levybacteria bacterium]|nr:hypothetical protein [Candidatus Levybacteria bacterium]
MKSKIFVSLLILSLLISLTDFASKASAIEAPNFPLCTSPQGEVLASYSSGTHGVPGDSTTYLGEDVVFKVNENQVLQCLCTIDGQGIQTNWWQFEALSIDQIETLKSQGWIFVPDGSLWGLKSVPYFAKNAGFACRPPGQPGAGGEVISVGAKGEILGVSLAPTGNIVYILGAFLIGGILILAGVLLRLKTRKHLGIK